MAPRMIHVSILLQCPNPLAFHPLQAVPVSLDLAGGLSLSLSLPSGFLCFFVLQLHLTQHTFILTPLSFPLSLTPLA